MSKALTPVQEVKNSIERLKPEFAKALPSHIPVEKFVRTLQTAVSTTPKLVEAQRQSLFAACTKAAQDGLLPDGREAAIVTFNSKNGVQAQYMPMVGGILKKVRNSGELASITAQIVYENDDFQYWVDEDGEHVSHKPNIFEDRGKRIAAYALAKTKDSAVYIEVMTMKEIDDVKAVSKGKNGPWSGPFAGEMIKKTVMKRLAKRLPMSTDLELTMNADNDLYDLEGGRSESTPEPAPKTPSKLKGLIDTEEDVIDVTPEVSEEEIPV